MSLNDEREIARLYADPSTPTSEIRARFNISDSSLYRIVQRQGTPLRGHRSAAKASATPRAPERNTHRKHTSSDGRQAPAPLAAARSNVAVAEHVSGIASATRGRSAPRRSVAQQRMPASLVPIARSNSTGTRFRILYVGERVFEAQRSMTRCVRRSRWARRTLCRSRERIEQSRSRQHPASLFTQMPVLVRLWSG